MFYDEHRGRVIGEIKETLKNTSYIRDYLTEVRHSSSQFSSKDRLVIRLWLKKDIKDAEDVTLTLAGVETLEEKIKRMAAEVNLVVTYDIYNV
ncbi:MAG: hypothetical protein K0R18_265 [Bacillales bacterium]|jgi:biotin-(acetyl-CoA carboxylase) ligase|nr:hypothetical protein [Bacillales bacterium]